MNILELPDDVLEAIVLTWEPRSHDYCEDWPVKPPQLVLKQLLVLGLVCRRWRIVVIPYHFRRIVVSNRSYTTQPHHLPEMLNTNRNIAFVVRSLAFDHHALDVPTLYTLTDSRLLPALTKVAFNFSVAVPPALLTIPLALPLHGKVVGEGSFVQDLIVNIGHFGTLINQGLRALAVVLGCYTRVGILSFRGGSDWWTTSWSSSGLGSSGENALPKFPIPTIEQLDVEEATSGCLLLLMQCSAPPHITCLNIASESDQSLDDITSILCIINSSLIHLKLRISRHLDPSSSSWRIDENEMESRTSTCLIFCAPQRMQHFPISYQSEGNLTWLFLRLTYSHGRCCSNIKIRPLQVYSPS